ncbi:hypothetical protein phiFa_29 [Thermus phage phiFa]|nr:hypothetical protein phiFa_29 [Thermus phage phiFa]
MFKKLAQVYLDYAAHMRLQTLVEVGQDYLLIRDLTGHVAEMRDGVWKIDKCFKHPAFLQTPTRKLLPTVMKWVTPVLQYYAEQGVVVIPEQPQVLVLKAGQKPAVLPKEYADALPTTWHQYPVLAYEEAEGGVVFYCERRQKLVSMQFWPKGLVRVLDKESATALLLRAWEELTWTR